MFSSSFGPNVLMDIGKTAEDLKTKLGQFFLPHPQWWEGLVMCLDLKIRREGLSESPSSQSCQETGLP